MTLEHMNKYFLADVCAAAASETNVGGSYFVYISGSKTYDDAVDNCATLYPGSRLARPTNTAEMDEMKRVSGKDTRDTYEIIGEGLAPHNGPSLNWGLEKTFVRFFLNNPKTSQTNFSCA